MIVAQIFSSFWLMIVNDRGSWKKWSFLSLENIIKENLAYFSLLKKAYAALK